VGLYHRPPEDQFVYRVPDLAQRTSHPAGWGVPFCMDSWVVLGSTQEKGMGFPCAYKHVVVLLEKEHWKKNKIDLKLVLKWTNPYLSNARAIPQGGEFRSAWIHGWFWEFRTNRTREFPGTQTRGVEQDRCLCFGIDGLYG
jgi:hypothetical protein